MSTSGIYGFYKNGLNKLTYNYSDSYPDHLGRNIVDFVRANSTEELNQIFDRIVLVHRKSYPSPEQIREFADWLGDDNFDGESWSEILALAEGNIGAYWEGLRYMTDYNDFIKKSLTCEWGYVINLDENVLEIYTGFNKEPQPGNRYSIAEPDNGYYQCKLITSFPFDHIPNNWIKEVY